MDETLNHTAAPPAVPAPAQSAVSGGPLRRLHSAVDVVYREMAKFGVVGLLAFVVDLYVYNVLRTGVWPIMDAPMHDKPLLSKVISVSVATVVAWVGNRYWTFRHRRRSAPRAEFVLFVVMNAGGLVISLGCLWISHYVLGLTSSLADNVSGNVIGLGLGTLFRFWAYRQFVFTEFRRPTPIDAA
jgi:putative flippase GtrA